MTTVDIKTALLEKVKRFSNSEAKRVYGMVLEYDLNDSLFNSFDEIPSAHKLLLKKGQADLRHGRKQNAKEFIKDIKKKYA
jgi:hypothetical protein